MSASLRFSAAMRLSGQRAFARVFGRRQAAGNGVITVHVCPRPETEPPQGRIPPVRLGLSVSRRVGPAVRRQRWKRRLREAFRQHQHQILPGWDYVVVVRAQALPEVDELASMLQSLGHQAIHRSRGRTRQPRPRRKESP
jgi:ribonuclease P protein component